MIDTENPPATANTEPDSTTELMKQMAATLDAKHIESLPDSDNDIYLMRRANGLAD